MSNSDFFKLMSLNSFIHSLKKLFPTSGKNILAANIVGLYHFLGAFTIINGLILKPEYLYIHIFLTTFILFTYHVFNDNCFVTMISDFLCNKDTNPLVIPITRAKKFIYINLCLSIIFYIYPQIAPYTLIKKILPI